MLELIQITNDPAFARRCDAIPGMRLWVDLEQMGKAERQAGRDTFISAHVMDDVGRIRDAARQSRFMVRVNPMHPGTEPELEAVLSHDPDLVMLPMFENPGELAAFVRLVAGRATVVALLETAGALQSVQTWIADSGVGEVYIGLNDLHLSLGLRFMFEPLADGSVDRVAALARARGVPFGFGGIARLDEGLLHGLDVLGEHVRLGSGAVILSRTFHRAGIADDFENQVALLRDAEARLALRTHDAAQVDAARTAARIRAIASQMDE